MSTDLYQKIDEVLKYVPESRHSYFQLKYFVIGKEPTIQAKLWKCLRELQVRKETIDDLLLSIEDQKDELELLEIRQAKEEPTDREQIIRKRQLERKRTKLLKSIEKLELDVKYATQEARFFLQAFEGLLKIEELKDYDDLEAQKEYWNESITQQINLKMLLQQPLDIELAKTALALHDDAPVKNQLIKLLNCVKELNGPENPES